MTSLAFAITTLSENPEFFEETIQLIEEGFHYSSENHFEIDFAPLVHPLNFENCFLMIDQKTNTVAAHLAVCKREIIKGEALTQIALIGGIVTRKKYRGQNLFKQLMNFAIEKLANDVSLFILWSDIENLYEKFLFYRAGGLIETGTKNFNSSDRPSSYEKTKFNKLSEKDFSTIINLYSSFNEKYFFTITRDEKDWSIIQEMKSVDLYIKRNSEGSIDKYFCVNKGRDLTNIIHEISCKDEAEFKLMLKDLSNYKLWLPESEQSFFPHTEIFYTAFMRVGNLALLRKFLYTISHKQLEIISNEHSILKFTFNEQTFEATEKEFLQYIFGPRPLEEFKEFGLSLYIAGLDSI